MDLEEFICLDLPDPPKVEAALGYEGEAREAWEALSREERNRWQTEAWENGQEITNATGNDRRR